MIVGAGCFNFDLWAVTNSLSPLSFVLVLRYSAGDLSCGPWVIGMLLPPPIASNNTADADQFFLHLRLLSSPPFADALLNHQYSGDLRDAGGLICASAEVGVASHALCFLVATFLVQLCSIILSHGRDSWSIYGSVTSRVT